jgi:hypothetical protein
MKAGWRAKLMFPFQVKLFDHATLCPNSFTQQDLNAFIGVSKYGPQARMYFDPQKYPPPSVDKLPSASKAEKAIAKQLRLDLQFSAFQSGQVLISSGSSGNGKNIIIKCTRCRTHTKRGKGQVPSDFCQQSIHGCRIKNSRGPVGLTLAKRTNTGKPTESGLICHYRFTI